MTVKKALKEKNRLAKEIKELYDIVRQHNSIEVGNTRRYSVVDKLLEARELVDELVVLKAQIHRANAPVYDKIFKLSELKSIAKELRSIPTEEGRQANGYSQVVLNKAVEINIVDKEALIKAVEKDIEKLQDELDIHNATTNIY